MSSILKHGDNAIKEIVRPFETSSETVTNKFTDDTFTDDTSSEVVPAREQKQTQFGESDGVTRQENIISPHAFDTLSQQNEKLLLALEKAKKQIEESEKAAFEKGKKAGLSEAETDEKKKLSLLSEASRSAVANIDERLESLEGLAILLAQNAINKVLGPDQHMADLVVQSVAHRVGALKEHGNLQIKVSSTDFSNENDLRFLSDQVGQSDVEIASDAKLSSGDCTISMKLGTIDVGLPGQLEKINILLNEILDEDGS